MSGNRTMYVGTTEWLDIQVTNSAGVQFNSQSVYVAFVPTTGGTPNWNAAGWSGPVSSTRTVSILMGTGGVALPAAGTWNIYVKITDNPEVPFLFCGTLTVLAT